MIPRTHTEKMQVVMQLLTSADRKMETVATRGGDPQMVFSDDKKLADDLASGKPVTVFKGWEEAVRHLSPAAENPWPMGIALCDGTPQVVCIDVPVLQDAPTVATLLQRASSQSTTYEWQQNPAFIDWLRAEPHVLLTAACLEQVPLATGFPDGGLPFHVRLISGANTSARPISVHSTPSPSLSRLVGSAGIGQQWQILKSQDVNAQDDLGRSLHDHGWCANFNPWYPCLIARVREASTWGEELARCYTYSRSGDALLRLPVPADVKNYNGARDSRALCAMTYLILHSPLFFDTATRQWYADATNTETVKQLKADLRHPGTSPGTYQEHNNATGGGYVRYLVIPKDVALAALDALLYVSGVHYSASVQHNIGLEHKLALTPEQADTLKAQLKPAVATLQPLLTAHVKLTFRRILLPWIKDPADRLEAHKTATFAHTLEGGVGGHLALSRSMYAGGAVAEEKKTSYRSSEWAPETKTAKQRAEARAASAAVVTGGASGEAFDYHSPKNRILVMRLVKRYRNPADAGLTESEWAMVQGAIAHWELDVRDPSVWEKLIAKGDSAVDEALGLVDSGSKSSSSGAGVGGHVTPSSRTRYMTATPDAGAGAGASAGYR